MCVCVCLFICVCVYLYVCVNGTHSFAAFTYNSAVDFPAFRGADVYSSAFKFYDHVWLCYTVLFHHAAFNLASV